MRPVVAVALFGAGLLFLGRPALAATATVSGLDLSVAGGPARLVVEAIIGLILVTAAHRVVTG